MRNTLAKVTNGHAELVATIRTNFAQPTADLSRAYVDTVGTMLAAELRAVADLLRDVKEDLTAYADFPHAYWRRLWVDHPNRTA